MPASSSAPTRFFDFYTSFDRPGKHPLGQKQLPEEALLRHLSSAPADFTPTQAVTALTGDWLTGPQGLRQQVINKEKERTGILDEKNTQNKDLTLENPQAVANAILAIKKTNPQRTELAANVLQLTAISTDPHGRNRDNQEEQTLLRHLVVRSYNERKNAEKDQFNFAKFRDAVLNTQLGPDDEPIGLKAKINAALTTQEGGYFYIKTEAVEETLDYLQALEKAAADQSQLLADEQDKQKPNSLAKRIGSDAQAPAEATGCIETCDKQTKGLNERVSQIAAVMTKLDADIRAQVEKIPGLPNPSVDRVAFVKAWHYAREIEGNPELEKISPKPDASVVQAVNQWEASGAAKKDINYQRWVNSVEPLLNRQLYRRQEQAQLEVQRGQIAGDRAQLLKDQETLQAIENPAKLQTLKPTVDARIAQRTGYTAQKKSSPANEASAIAATVTNEADKNDFGLPNWSSIEKDDFHLHKAIKDVNRSLEVIDDLAKGLAVNPNNNPTMVAEFNREKIKLEKSLRDLLSRLQRYYDNNTSYLLKRLPDVDKFQQRLQKLTVQVNNPWFGRRNVTNITDPSKTSKEFAHATDQSHIYILGKNGRKEMHYGTDGEPLSVSNEVFDRVMQKYLNSERAKRKSSLFGFGTEVFEFVDTDAKISFLREVAADALKEKQEKRQQKSSEQAAHVQAEAGNTNSSSLVPTGPAADVDDEEEQEEQEKQENPSSDAASVASAISLSSGS